MTRTVLSTPSRLRRTRFTKLSLKAYACFVKMIGLTGSAAGGLRLQSLSATRRFNTRFAFRISNGGSNLKGEPLPR